MGDGITLSLATLQAKQSKTIRQKESHSPPHVLNNFRMNQIKKILSLGHVHHTQVNVQRPQTWWTLNWWVVDSLGDFRKIFSQISPYMSWECFSVCEVRWGGWQNIGDRTQLSFIDKYFKPDILKWYLFFLIFINTEKRERAEMGEKELRMKNTKLKQIGCLVNGIWRGLGGPRGPMQIG